MREILFRGKRIDNGKWIEGVAFPHDNQGAVTMFYQNKGDGALEGKEVDPQTVGQYTGLTANGKKIFEGDYIGTRIWSEWDDTTVLREGVVVFKNGGFFISLKGSNLDVFILEERFEEPYFEVIGNIHDNPELLEAKE